MSWDRVSPRAAALAAATAVVMGCGSRPVLEAPPKIEAPAPELHDWAVPQAYHLDLVIDPERTEFQGRVRIDVELRRATDALWLHSLALEIHSATLTTGGQSLPLKASVDTESETLRLDAGRSVAPGRVRLELSFTGRLGDDIGLFRQKVDDRWYVITDFQPVDARRAFPSFDTPRFRTPWSVSVRVPRGLVVAGNTPIVSREPVGDDDELIRFETTPPLPSYLVALAVGPFDEVQGPRDPVPLRALTPRGRAHLARPALALMPRYIDALVEYTGIEPPLRKLDLVAVPRMNGAMENHGLFTFDDDILLVPVDAELERVQLLHMVLAHEAAHIYFGNLVGFRRWTELWLSEGFATWMADELGMMHHPEERIASRRVVYRHDAMEVDGSPWARAMNQLRGAPRRPAPKRASPELATGARSRPSRYSRARLPERAFDPLSYKKGGALLGMAEAQLGEDEFRRRVRRFLGRWRDRAAPASALIAALGPAGPSVESFVAQPGYPLIAARADCRDDPVIEITQRPASAPSGASASSPARWIVPVCVAYGTAKGAEREHVCELLDAERARLAVDACPSWVFPLAGASSYVRAELGGEREVELEVLQNAPLETPEWAALIDSVAAAVDSGRMAPQAAAPVLAAGLRRRDQHVTELVLRLVERLGAHFPERAERIFGGALGEVIRERARELAFARLREDAPAHDRIHRRQLTRLAIWLWGDRQLAARARTVAAAPLGGELTSGRIAALEAVGANLDAAGVAAAIGRAERGDRRAHTIAVGTLAAIRGNAAAAAALRGILDSAALRPYLGVLIASYATRPHTAEAVLDFARAHPRVASETLRAQLGYGLCNRAHLAQLDRLVPPGPEDTAGQRIRHCARSRARLRRALDPGSATRR